MVIDVLSWLLLVSGSCLCVIGGIGIHRLPEFYSRTHAASLTDTLGSGLLLAGLALQATDVFVAIKLVMVWCLLLVTGPVAGHALVKAAAGAGLRFSDPSGGEHAD
jgi:multicomponent Na+:H+ antiporter subunit G